MAREDDTGDRGADIPLIGMARRFSKTRVPTGRAPAIYEVRLSVDPAIRRDFDLWLDGHVREMIALPGFYDARIIHAEPEDGGRLRRIVRYRLRDRAALDHYFERHAKHMRADGQQRFHGKFTAERDVYSALPEAEETGHRRCPNCGAVAEPNFCPVCGQEQRDVHISFWRLLQDFLSDTFTFDSRLVRSIGPLFGRPGFLTREYFEGRRARYIPPLRLYLFISIVFFALLAVMLADLQVNDSQPVIFTENQLPVEPDATDEKVPASPRPGEVLPAFTIDVTEPESEFERRLVERGRKIGDQPAIFIHDLVGNMPLMMFLLMPVYTLVLRILYPLAGYVYLEHLIFSLHVHSFTFLILGFLLVANWSAEVFAPTAVLWPWNAAFGLYLLVYPWFAMRRAYRQGIFLTTVKYLLQSVIYLTLLTTSIVGVAIATLYWF